MFPFIFRADWFKATSRLLRDNDWDTGPSQLSTFYHSTNCTLHNHSANERPYWKKLQVHNLTSLALTQNFCWLIKRVHHPTEVTKSDSFLSANSGVFISFSALLRIAVQVIIKTCEHDSSIQAASLSSNSGHIGRRPCGAFLPFGISDKSFCFFLQSLTSFSLIEKRETSRSHTVICIFSKSNHSKFKVSSITVAFARHDSKRKQHWG